MGSPGTFGLSVQKAQKVRDLMVGPSGAAEAETQVPTEVPQSARARRFFAGILSDRQWGGLLSGQEWRAAAGLLTGLVAAARVNASQQRLEQWVERQGFMGETALIRLGSELLERLDADLPERDVIGFELASYALRRTVDELYATDRSPFDVDRELLLQRLPKIDTEKALVTYIGSYLQELVRYITGGLPAATDAEEKLRSSFLSSVQKDEVPKLARDFLATLRQYSERKYGSGRPLAEMLDDVPEWLADAAKELFKGDAK
ncbi:MAG TPA: hypothetical protein VF756_27125 [Thermoanaerobaculia bacterium]